MYEIVVGRSDEEREKWGLKGTILFAKHYVKMGQTTSLSTPIYMDIAKAHVVFIVGKRGSGKSYSMGVIAEGLSDIPPEIAKNISIILLDTMGIYWTMKYPNKKDELLLEQWGMKPKGLNVTIFTPGGFFESYRQQGIPTDYPFYLKPSEFDAMDWCSTFEIDINGPIGIVIERAVTRLKLKGENYDIDQIIKEIQSDTRTEQHIKDAAENRFLNMKLWGIFSKDGTPLQKLAAGGQVTVLDVSCYATHSQGWKVKSLIVGLIAKNLFIDRMIARKNEEFVQIKHAMHYFELEEKKEQMPLVWLVIDEAHEFLPSKGSTVASQPLITILREGRQPGISLVLASQQPGKIHTDVMTQADTVIAHRITAKLDTEALGSLMQSYMREGLNVALDNLPRVKGAGIIFDDQNEKMFPMRVRPRITWHGGESPTAIPVEKKEY